MIMKNKRGDIPITILVIGVLAICLLAIFSFYASDKNVKKDFVVIRAVEEVSLAKERIEFYERLGFDEEEIDKIFGIDSDEQGKFFNITRGKINVRYNFPN